MIDMHSHILFGVDDGAKVISYSLGLIEEEVSRGVSHIILTPHYSNRCTNLHPELVRENFKKLKDLVIEKNIKVMLYLGNEVYLGSDYCETIWQEPFYTLAGSDYILIEFDVVGASENIPEVCYEAGIKGYIPILAHVERYETLYDNKQLISDILSEGAHFQVNASAIIGGKNKESDKFVHYLLKERLVSFAASDVHNLDTRDFHLDEAYGVVRRLYGELYANKIFCLNQQNIIMNRYFDSPKLVCSTNGVMSKIFKRRGVYYERRRV